METLTGTPSKAGSIHKMENGYVGLPSMNESDVDAGHRSFAP
ncbi:MAG: hypothetical protein ABI563_13990 [Specibacter sp.]